jgi:hypothetical protein
LSLFTLYIPSPYLSNSIQIIFFLFTDVGDDVFGESTDMVPEPSDPVVATGTASTSTTITKSSVIMPEPAASSVLSTNSSQSSSFANSTSSVVVAKGVVKSFSILQPSSSLQPLPVPRIHPNAPASIVCDSCARLNLDVALQRGRIEQLEVRLRDEDKRMSMVLETTRSQATTIQQQKDEITDIRSKSEKQGSEKDLQEQIRQLKMREESLASDLRLRNTRITELEGSLKEKLEQGYSTLKSDATAFASKVSHPFFPFLLTF